MGLDEASCQRGVDRLLVTSQMIKGAGLVGEPGGGPGIAGAKTQPGLHCFESLIVTAVKAQRNTKVKITKSEIPIQFDCATRVRYRGTDIASPMARLGERVLGLWVFTIERHSLKGRFPCVTH